MGNTETPSYLRPNSESETPVIALRVTRAQLNALNIAAKRAGITRSSYIRQCLAAAVWRFPDDR